MPGTTAEPQALKYVGDMYMQRGMLPEAILEYEKAIKLAPTGWDWAWRIHLTLAYAYRDIGYSDKAIREYQTVLESVPLDEEVRHELDRLESEK
jgi:tetratricopeptide (TPR) repeat protein